jgi:hypothetical protein
MAEELENKPTEEKKEAPKSGLLLASEELRQIRERYAGAMSDGGSSGRSDSNDNQNQMP